jgi:hypothetical protein
MGYLTHEDMELQHVTSRIRIARNKNQRDLLPWHVALAPQTMTPGVKKLGTANSVVDENKQELS